MGKIKVVMNKPVYLGQAILDLSKIVMYEFHYNYMVPKYGDIIYLFFILKTFTMSHTFTWKGAEVIKILIYN